MEDQTTVEMTSTFDRSYTRDNGLGVSMDEASAGMVEIVFAIGPFFVLGGDVYWTVERIRPI
jgi:hypothetical protein